MGRRTVHHKEDLTTGELYIWLGGKGTFEIVACRNVLHSGPYKW